MVPLTIKMVRISSLFHLREICQVIVEITFHRLTDMDSINSHIAPLTLITWLDGAGIVGIIVPDTELDHLAGILSIDDVFPLKIDITMHCEIREEIPHTFHLGCRETGSMGGEG